MDRKFQGRLMNIMFPRIPLWDPDRFLCRWLPVVRPFLSWWGTLLWLTVVISAIAVVAPDWKIGTSTSSTGTNGIDIIWHKRY